MKIILFLFLIPFSLCAQDYSIVNIPDTLISGANVVKRFEELRIEQRTPEKVRFYRKYAYTILNETGLKYSIFYDHYDKWRDLHSIDGNLYDAFGKRIKSIKKKDIADVSGSDKGSLADDVRYKVHDFSYREFPFTVEYEVEADADGILGLPLWNPIPESNISVQQSKLTIVSPAITPIRFKQRNYVGAPLIEDKDNKKIVTWELKNVKAKKTEPYAPSWDELTTSVMLGLSEFEADGYKGNMSTWEGYGKYIYKLINGRDVLPDDIKKKVHELTVGISDPKKKVEVLYKFMQDNTRYISIQLGIGGWQPFDAKYVAEKRYGDCKALSNYTVALLKEAGITAKYVEINSGRDKSQLTEDFPCSQFNHVVACVPLGKDTVWLECTDPTRSAGFMGSSTGNRKAMLIDEDGGHIVSTPQYTAKENLQMRKTMATINEAGNLRAEMNTTFTGIQQQIPHALIYAPSKKMRDEYLNDLFNLPTYQVEKSEYTERKAILPSVNEFLIITASGYASITGKRLFVQPNIFNISEIKLSTDKPRQYDIVYREAFKDIDTIQIKIPDGYVPEAVPKNVIIDNQFGRYSISYVIKDNLIELVRFYERNPARYPAKDYPDFVKFYNDIYKADRARIVFVKKEG